MIVTTTTHATSPIPDADTSAMLECLREAVAEALDRKQRLGQYWVQWTADGPRLIGADAPTSEAAGAE
jgi:hypothetical protein